MKAFYIINSTNRRKGRFFANTGIRHKAFLVGLGGLVKLLIRMGYANGYNCLLLPPVGPS